MLLSDRDLMASIEAGKLRVSPLGENAVQPASVDIRLSWSGRE
jgi:dCTP deaminase